MPSHRLFGSVLLCLAASGLCLAPTARAADGSPVPRVVLVTQHQGTEITDLLVPYALLAAAGAEVIVAATEPGRVSLWPTLSLEVGTALDAVGPVDLVVVPAVHDPRDPALVRAVRALHGSGARVASICDGVFVLAEAGLLDGVPATGHFYSRGRRERRYPEVQWVEDRRYVEAGTILTSAGVSASGPAAVRLVEVLFGPERAAAVAEDRKSVV